MAEFEARLNAIDEFLEEQFQLNPEGGLDEYDESINQQDIIVDQPGSFPEDTYNSSDSHHGRRTMPHIPTQRNPTKRSVQDTEFSSPEDSPAYKLLKCKFEEQQRLAEYAMNQNKDLKEQFASLKSTVLEAIPCNNDGSFK